MSVRTLNWLKFGGLVGLAFALGLLFAGLLDLPHRSTAQERSGSLASGQTPIRTVQAPVIPGTQALVTLSDAFASVAEKVRPTVVYIRAKRTEKARVHTRRNIPPGMEPFFRLPREPQVQQGSGSGFIISEDGYILTNNHVVEEADQVTVKLFDQREFPAKVIGTDPATDVAVLKINAKDLTPAALGDSDAERVGEWVLAIGNPLGGDLTFTVTSGIISAKGRGLTGLPNRSRESIQDFIQTDAAINPGNSGGPLVNVRGEVIGINSAIASETGFNVGYGFAIPINLAKTVMNQLITHGKVERAALGVLVGEATAVDAEYAKLPAVKGVRVQDFPENSPAAKAGIEVGDIITAVDGKPVDYVAQLQQIVGFRRPGEVVKVEVARKGGVRKTFSVRLMSQNDTQPEAEKPADSAGDEGSPSPRGSSMDLLGVQVKAVTPEIARDLQIDPSIRGLLVTEVDPEGPAFQNLNDLSTRAPDIIIAVEGKPIRTEAELRAAIRDAGPGGILSMQVYNVALKQRRIERIKLSDGKM